MDASADRAAELRGFNVPVQHRMWRDVILPRLILPLFWLYWALLLPSWALGLRQRRQRRSEQRTMAIEAGIVGWTQVFFEELGASASDYFCEGQLVRHVIDRESPYLPQQRANFDRDDPSHVVVDVRNGGQSWRRSLLEALGTAWYLNRHGMTPIVIMTDAFYRRQRWHAAVLTAFRGVVVTYASAEILRPIFPHRRVIGPMIMPMSRARLRWLDEYSTVVPRTGSRVQFIGHVYSPRKEFLDLVAQRLGERGIDLTVNGDKWGTSNEDYWRTRADADVIVTTTMQGPDRPIVDWNWVQQAVFRFMEAMSAGAALVASDVPGIARFFKPGTDFVDFVSVDDSVAGIERLVRDSEHRRAVASAGHAKATALVEADAFWALIDAGLGPNTIT